MPALLWAQSDTLSKQELEQLNRELDNPLAKRWSLVFQDNISWNQGTAVDGSVTSNTFFFQPLLPLPVGKNKVFSARPVFPIITQPNFSQDPTGSQKITGFGDIQLAAFLGPGNAAGLVWGAGATFSFPTATDDAVGYGKYTAGPAVMIFHLAKKWNKGLFFQHWTSYAGDDLRGDVNKSDLQYVIRRNFGVWSLGMGPSIVVDWTRDPNQRLTFPIGLGYTRMVKFGNTPVKLRVEPQYSIIRPDNYGTVWNLRLQIAPIIGNPFF